MSLWKCMLFLLFHQMTPLSPLSHSLLVPAIVLIPSCRSLASLRIFPSTVSALVISDPLTVAAIFQWPILPLCNTSSLNSIFGTLPSGSSLAMKSGNVPLTMPSSVPSLAKVAILESTPDTLISVSVLALSQGSRSLLQVYGRLCHLLARQTDPSRNFRSFQQDVLHQYSWPAEHLD